jgi:hemolysin III
MLLIVVSPKFLSYHPENSALAVLQPGPLNPRSNMSRCSNIAAAGEPTQLSRPEEIVNALTHGAGLALSVVGAALMVAVVMTHGDSWRVLGCSVYVASLIAVYAMSTLSHGCTTPRWRDFFRALDQGFIYLLIAATYTPFSLAYLRTAPWWLLLGAVWAIALYGFISKVFFAHRLNAVAIWPCIVLGWMPTISVPALSSVVPIGAFWWMLVGGICYSLGTIFLICDSKVRHFHAVWHLFVIAGSVCHFVAILFFVAS